MQTPEALQAARLALLEGAVLALLRAAQEDGFDGITIEASSDDGQTVIDLNYLKGDMLVTGHDL